MPRIPKNLEAYYDLIEPGADRKIIEEINQIGKNTEEDIGRAEQKSFNSELHAKEQRAVKELNQNSKLQERLKKFLGEFSAFITVTGEFEKTRLSEVLARFENGEYDDDLFIEYPKQIGEMSVVVPEFDIDDFLENIKILTAKDALLTNNMDLSEVFEQVNERINQLEEDINIAKKWHTEYQKGIRSGAARLEEEMKKRNK